MLAGTKVKLITKAAKQKKEEIRRARRSREIEREAKMYK